MELIGPKDPALLPWACACPSALSHADSVPGIATNGTASGRSCVGVCVHVRVCVRVGVDSLRACR